MERLLGGSLKLDIDETKIDEIWKEKLSIDST